MTEKELKDLMDRMLGQSIDPLIEKKDKKEANANGIQDRKRPHG